MKVIICMSRHRWADNIKMYFTEIVWSGIYWTDLALYRDQLRAPVNMIINLLVL
jgi:hypothetical protein